MVRGWGWTMRIHFTGIGGRGMNPIAQFLQVNGYQISGSDRYYDRGENSALFDKLKKMGIKIYKQDGQEITSEIDLIIISSAIEKDNPDLIKAIDLGIPIIKRAEMLASIFNAANGIAVGGTSGKTTVLGMLATILMELNQQPTVFLGGELQQNYQPAFTGNFINGSSNLICIEADESDGTIIHYQPHIGIITNVSKDHQEVEQLLPLFQKFADNTKNTLIVNADCPNSKNLYFKGKKISFGLSDGCQVQAKEIKISKGMIEFSVDGIKFTINQWGKHNLENALAAIAAAKEMGLELYDIARVLSKFKGVKRRMEFLGENNQVSFFDDYAHNPSKIKASLLSVKKHFDKIIVIYQCHGYTPTKFMWHELIEVFCLSLDVTDVVILPPIYHVGGTADRSISAEQLASELKKNEVPAHYCENRNQIKVLIDGLVAPNTCIIVMGARDETLSQFARDLLKNQ